MQWTDATSYSRDEPSPRKPRSWRLRLTRDIQIVVVSNHINYRGDWVMHCEPWFNTFDMKLPATADNAAEAQRRALALVRHKVDELAAALAETKHL